MYTHGYTCGGQSLMLSVFLCYFPPHILKQDLLWKLELISFAVLAGLQITGLLLSLFLQYWYYMYMHWLFRWILGIEFCILSIPMLMK